MKLSVRRAALLFVWFRPLCRSLSPLLSATLTSEMSLEVNPPLSSFPHSLPSSLHPLISLSPLCPPPSIRVYQSPSYSPRLSFLVAPPRPGRVVMVTWAAWHCMCVCINAVRGRGLQDVTVQLRPDDVAKRGKVRIKWGTAEEEEERWMQVRKRDRTPLWGEQVIVCECVVDIVNIPLTGLKCVSSCDSQQADNLWSLDRSHYSILLISAEELRQHLILWYGFLSKRNAVLTERWEGGASVFLK